MRNCLLCLFLLGFSLRDARGFSIPARIVSFSPALSTAKPVFLEATKAKHDTPTLRSRMRKLTGFSLTALRLTLRTATGISLSAVYASMLAVTGQWIRQTMKFLLSLIPAPIRYFLQPFLILYYAPLFIIKNLAHPQNEKHEAFIDGWKQAVQIADETSANWPIHINENGDFEAETGVNMEQAIDASVELAIEETQKDLSS